MKEKKEGKASGTAVGHSDINEVLMGGRREHSHILAESSSQFPKTLPHVLSSFPMTVV